MDLGELGALAAGDLDELLEHGEDELDRHPTRPRRCPPTPTPTR